MKRFILLLVCISLGLYSFSQNKKSDYQDPAFWIDLEANKKNVPVKMTSESGSITYLSAPIKFISKKDEKLKAMEIHIDSIKYEAIDENRQIVYLDGYVNLSCCRNRPINMEFYDDDENLIQFSRTDELGNFKLKSINGNMMEIKNNKIKINFKKLKTIDENWDERYATLERESMPSENQIKRLQNKELKKTEMQSN